MYTSSDNEDGYRSLAASHGASEVLLKPASKQVIMSVIKSLNYDADDVPSELEVALKDNERLIAKQLRLSIIEAKAEIAGGLDTASQQLK